MTPWTRSAPLAVVVFALAGCPRPPKPDTPPDSPDVAAVKQTVVRGLGECVLSTSQEFLTRAATLLEATSAWRAAPSEATRDAARAAFMDAMDAWQVAEVMRFGPAAPKSLPGGGDLRDHIYSWPLLSRCAVEEQIVSKSYEAPEFPSSLVNRRGLGALEYLLFVDGADTACGPTSAIVANGTWAALSLDERSARRRAYADLAAADLRARAQALVDGWDPAKGNFLETFATAGTDNKTFASHQAALNVVSDALFYVESEVKDMKLSRPLGLRLCDAATCPEALESPFAGRSKANIRANLVGAQRVLFGCAADGSGQGFDDVLVALGSQGTVDRLRAAHGNAIASIDAVEEPDLDAALAQDLASVRAVHDNVKGLTDLMKTELATVLDLELPLAVASDND